MQLATRGAAGSRGLAVSAWFGLMLVTVTVGPSSAAGCSFEPQGEGRVAAILDARSFRLEDGREIRLAGIEPAMPGQAMPSQTALSAMLAGREVRLRGEDDAPDRYGRQTALVFLADSETSVQSELLKQGQALVSSDVTNRDCASLLMAAEAEARHAKRGAWAGAAAIKNAESSDDISAGIGRFALVEGKVLSVRQTGATTYLNFGRNWTRDFAVTISRRAMPGVESAGLAVKSLEKRRIRVRGWVDARGGPRIEVLRAGQIEVLDGN